MNGQRQYRAGSFKVTAIAGTELAAPNGIEVSADGKTFYVAVFGTHEFVRFVRRANGLKYNRFKAVTKHPTQAPATGMAGVFCPLSSTGPVF